MRKKSGNRVLRKMRTRMHLYDGHSQPDVDPLLRVLFDDSVECMALLEPDGKVIRINATAAASLNDDAPDVIGSLFWETPWFAASSEQQSRVRHGIKAASDGEQISFETSRSTRRGTAYCDLRLTPVMDGNGKTVLLVAQGFDITERKISEIELRKSEWKFRAIFNQQFELMGILALDGTLLEANRTALTLAGVDESEVYGRPFWETPWWTHSPELQRRVREAVEKAAAGGHVALEVTHPGADGTLHYLDFFIKPVKDDDGKPVYLVPESRDVTEQKLAERALNEAAVKYRIVADNTYNWEFWLSPEGKFIYSSPACERITGHTAEEFFANPMLMNSLIHNDDLEIWQDHHERSMVQKEHTEIEFRIWRDGQIRWIHHVCIPIYDESRNYLGTRGSFEEISKRKQAEEKNLLLATVVESSDDAIFAKTADGIITSWNGGAEKIFGYVESEVLGKPVTILFPPERELEILQAHERIRLGEHIEHYETVCRKKDGELIDMSLTYSPIKDEKGRVVAISATGRDITARKRAEAALRENEEIRRELELHEKELLLLRQSRLAAMGEMIGNIAHQWRQPLNMLGLCVQELSMTFKKGNLSAEYMQGNVAKMMETIRHMSRTIDDFRDFTKPDKEKVDFSLVEVIKRTISLQQSTLNAENIRIEVVSECDPVMNGHPNEFSQVLLNIMINARDAFLSRKTADPRVTIVVGREGGQCVVTITDNGGGIPEEIMDKIFDPYFTTKEPDKGTGIGLYMSKTIIEKNMGGKLTARNVNGGAQFRISF